MARKVTRPGLRVVRYSGGMALGLAVGICTAPLLATGPAFAQPKGAAAKGEKDEKAEALELFNQSADLYRQGKFDEAAKLLEKAYAMHPEPVLLYNLGRAYEGLGENEKAIDAYTRYLKDAPEAKDRGALEKRIETLKAQIEKDKKLKQREEEAARPEDLDETAPEQPKPVADDQTGGAGVWPWVVTGVGVATIGAGFFVGIQAKSKRDEAQDNPVNRDANSDFEDAKSLAKTANTLIIAGAIITAGGVTWAILGSKKKKAETSKLHVTVLPTGLRVGGHL